MTRSRASAKAAGARFEQMVERGEGCWIWQGAPARNGYGGIFVDGRRVIAHRFAYELHKGPIPEGLEIDHLCGVRLCVNPSHLEAVTHAENMRRARRSHCVNGHSLDDANIYVHQGKRYCRTCRRERNRARRAA